MVRSITRGNEFWFLKTPFTKEEAVMEGEFRVTRYISFSKKYVPCLDNFMFITYALSGNWA